MRTITIWFSVAMMLAPMAQAASGDIYNLGTLGGDRTDGRAINASGEVAGYSRRADGEWHAFLYTGIPGVDGQMHDLGTLGGGYSAAFGINASGQVAGISTPSNPGSHAFLYSGTPGSGGQMDDVGTVGGSSSQAWAINDAGQIVGYSYLATGSQRHAFLYTGTPGIDGQMHDLGALDPAWVSEARSINSSGQIVGWSGPSAFLYTGTPGIDGQMYDLGGFDETYVESRAFAINDSGQIGGYSAKAGGSYHRAFLYLGTPGIDGKMHDLGTLGGPVSEVRAINSFGQVVGPSTKLTGPPHAYLYTGTPGIDGHMIDLDVWLDEVNPTEGANWLLQDAYGISDTGLIVGEGTYNDGPGGLSDGWRTCILDINGIPEPGSAALAAAGCLALLRRRGGSSIVVRQSSSIQRSCRATSHLA